MGSRLFWAVIVTAPAATPATRPVPAPTVAKLVWLLLQLLVLVKSYFVAVFHVEMKLI
jgi:hypothetical protein